MSKTIRHRIIEALASRLEDYSWDEIEPEIHVGRTTFDPDYDPLPVVTVVARPDESELTMYRADRRTMTLDVSVLIALDDAKEAGATGEALYGELHKAVFDGGALSLEFTDPEETEYFPLEFQGGGIADYPDTPSGPAHVTIAVTVSVTFETAHGDPYN